ncbi:MAG: hypothetical protein ACREND_00950 [Gemmatimonadaceae bacterium]
MTIRSVAIALACSTLCSAPVTAQTAAPTIFAPGVISGPANDMSPAFTPDGRTVFFTRSNSSQSTIVVSHFSNGKWSAPTIASFSGKWRDLEPTMAPDGSYLIFVSNRPAVAGGTALDAFYNGAAQPGAGGNLWRVDRTAGGWGEPRRLPNIVNGNSSIYSPSVAADGSLYFMQPAGALTKFHLYRAQFSHGAFEAPVAMFVAGDSVGDFDPAVAPDESFIVFSSTRIAAKGTSLFITVRHNGAWGAPTYLGDSISVPHTGSVEARLGPDHRTLYFSSIRVVPTPGHNVAASEKGLAMMDAWNDGLANIWQVPLDPWLGGHSAPGH